MGLGVSRAIRTKMEEHALSFEVDTLDESSSQALVKIYPKFLAQRRRGDPVNYEYSFHDNVIHISRLDWSPVTELCNHAQRNTTPKLENGKPGNLDSLSWSEKEYLGIAMSKMDMSKWRCVAWD